MAYQLFKTLLSSLSKYSQAFGDISVTLQHIVEFVSLNIVRLLVTCHLKRTIQLQTTARSQIGQLRMCQSLYSTMNSVMCIACLNSIRLFLYDTSCAKWIVMVENSDLLFPRNFFQVINIKTRLCLNILYLFKKFAVFRFHFCFL